MSTETQNLEHTTTQLSKINRLTRILAASTRNHWLLFTALVVLALLALEAVLTANNAAPPLWDVDPRAYVRFSQQIAAGDPLPIWDPPIRYYPLAALYMLTNASEPLAQQLAVGYAYTTSLVLVPLALAGYIYTATGKLRDAALTIIVFGILHGIDTVAGTGFVTPGLATTHWQYDIAAPLALVILTVTLKTIRTPTYRHGLAIGILGGVLALTQHTTALYIGIAVATALFSTRSWKPLLSAPPVGALIAIPPMAFLASGAGHHATRWWSYAFINLINGITAPSIPIDLIATLAVVVLTGLLYRRFKPQIPGFAVTLPAVAFALSIWTIEGVTRIQWIDWAAVSWGVPLFYTALIVTVVSTLTE